MKALTSFSALAGLSTTVHARSAPPVSRDNNINHQTLFQNPDPLSSSSSSSDLTTHRIPTSYESAILGRRILALSPLATLSTVFPSTYNTPTYEDADGVPQSDILESRPDGLGGVPIGLMDYIADCDPNGAAEEGSSKLGNGNPTILAIRIATSFKNVDAGSNMSVSVNWVPPHPPSKRIESHSSSSSSTKGLLGWLRGWLPGSSKHQHQKNDDDDDDDENDNYDPVPYSAANLPRFSLIGYLEPIATTPSTATIEDLQSCFLASHPDARYWLPGNRIHTSEWVRLVVTQVYWIGGFGDRAYIGWIPVEEWHNVTRAEWEAVRLPGEKKGWKEWSINGNARGSEWEL